MKKLLASTTSASLLLLALAVFAVAVSLPRTTHAAFDDVTIVVDTVLTVSGIDLTVSGATSSLSTITVGANNFQITLDSGSSIEVTSATGRVIGTNGQGFIATNTCTGGVSVLGFNATETTTITVGPTSEACSGAATTATASSGGGGGGGSGSGNGPIVSGGGGGSGVYSAPVITTTTTGMDTVIAQLQAQVQSLVAQLNALLAARGLSGLGSFTRDLKVGATGDDVKALQVYLNTHGYIVASSGPGSSGNETTKFGGLTRAALMKLQKAAGITPIAGYFGAKTRAYVAAHP
jgi:hypothetical protein